MFNGDTGRSRSASPAVVEEQHLVSMPATTGRPRRSATPPRGRSGAGRPRSRSGSSRSHHRLRTRSLPRNGNSVRRRYRTKSRGNRDLCMEYMTTRKCRYLRDSGFCKKSHHPRRRSRPKSSRGGRYPSPSTWRKLSRSPSIRTQTLMSAAAQVCFQFQRNGKCSYGGNCKFAHGENDPKHKDNGSKSAAPAETVNAAPGAKATTNNASGGGGSGTGGTGSPAKEKNQNSERRSDSPAAVGDGF